MTHWLALAGAIAMIGVGWVGKSLATIRILRIIVIIFGVVGPRVGAIEA